MILDVLMTVHETIGDRVKSARRKIGMSQAVLAEKTGVTQQAIGSLENNHSSDSRKLPEIATILKVDVNFLKTGIVSQVKLTDGGDYIKTSTNDFEYTVKEIMTALDPAFEASVKAAYRTLEAKGLLSSSGDVDLVEHKDYLLKILKVAVKAELTGDYLIAAISD